MVVRLVVLGGEGMEGAKEIKEGQNSRVNESCNAGKELVVVFSEAVWPVRLEMHPKPKSIQIMWVLVLSQQLYSDFAALPDSTASEVV